MIILGFPSNKITLGINIYKLLYRCYRSYALNLKLKKKKKSEISIKKMHLRFFSWSTYKYDGKIFNKRIGTSIGLTQI